MNKANLFRETLKRVGYPEAGILDDSDFDYFFTEKELVPFLEIFCSLTEDNVLTTEEIEEYSALTTDDLLMIENFSKSTQIEKTFPEVEKRNNICYLQEHLSQVENHNRSLERQINMFKRHEQSLIQERESSEKCLIRAKRKFQLYEMNKLPHAVDEFVSGLNSILDAVKDLEDLILRFDVTSSRLPTSNTFKDLVKQYTEDEEKIIQCIKPFLQDNFNLHEESNAMSLINLENTQNEESQKESVFLQKTLKITMLSDVMTEKEFLKTEAVAKYLENFETSDLDCQHLQLKNILDESLKVNEVLKKKEDDLKTYISDAITKYVNAQFADVAIKSSEETLKYIQYCNDVLLLPMDMLVSQRSRLEVLSSLLNKHSEKLKNLKELIQNTCTQIIEEKDGFQKRKLQVEKKMNESLPEDNVLNPETSVYLSLYRILATFDDPLATNLHSVTMQDVLQKASTFLEIRENMKRNEEEKLKVLEVLEEQASSMQKLLRCSDKEYLNWHESEQAVNACINNLDIKLSLLEKNISECNQDLDQKQRLLERKRNLCLARNLYVYALLNKQLFKKCINDIKIAVNESNDY